jgi:hypothetical protein
MAGTAAGHDGIREGPRTGAIAQRAGLAPRMQGFCGSGPAWAMDIREVVRVG